MAAEALAMDLKRQIAEFAIAQNKHNLNLAERLQQLVNQAESIILDTNVDEKVIDMQVQIDQLENELSRCHEWMDDAEYALDEINCSSKVHLDRPERV